MKRVKARMYRSYDESSHEYTETLIQRLQKRVSIFGLKILSFWITIDTEEVPVWAWIQRNTLGSTDWTSKWYGMENVQWKQTNK